jgi:hypothetical protein
MIFLHAAKAEHRLFRGPVTSPALAFASALSLRLLD